MKTFLISVIFAFAPAALAHDHTTDLSILNRSKVGAATAEALEMFETSGAGLLWTFQTESVNDEALSKIYFVTENTVKSASYDCHFHAHGDEQQAHCHEGGELNNVPSTAPALSFNVDAYLEGLASSMDVFERKISSLDNLTSIKMWQNTTEMFVTLSSSVNGVEAKAHFMCHIHAGTEIDCHRSRNAGPGEPSF
ncbi:hypothetical protein AZI85_00120 [Bdellovibrio bacteriovorus]|uniref:Superoxide dismutase copper/zinc binding domain-containing protein n=1 Tax=Bdellovibrio bacteriovorus TaxID=959 RepID=A0A150WV31_BDEBC|nr:hypothetical protein [Bdellovibrio bacteriovorus]KYG70400.1 hypothetical protein AZI85_00120 [Bdellovibrio bacteriovorus]